MKRGFTLVEMVIVVAITIILSGYIIIYGSSSRNQTAVHIEIAKLSQTIMRAKALTTTFISSSTAASDEPPCGYGVEIDYNAETYTLFAYERIGSGICLPLDNGGSSGRLNQGRKTPIGEVQNLPSGVELVRNGDSLADVLFRPPAPTTELFFDDASLNNSNEGFVYLRPVNGAEISISVNRGGQVNF